MVREDARLNLEQGRLKLAGAELAKARAWRPDDPETQFLRGRLRLAESAAAPGPEERERLERAAEDAFRKAIELDASLPGPHREMGLLLYGQHDHRGACAQLRRYRRLAPDARQRRRRGRRRCPGGDGAAGELRLDRGVEGLGRIRLE